MDKREALLATLNGIPADDPIWLELRAGIEAIKDGRSIPDPEFQAWKAEQEGRAE